MYIYLGLQEVYLLSSSCVYCTMSSLVEEAGSAKGEGVDKKAQIAKLLAEARASVESGNGAEALQKTLMAMTMNANGNEKAVLNMLDQ